MKRLKGTIGSVGIDLTLTEEGAPGPGPIPTPIPIPIPTPTPHTGRTIIHDFDETITTPMDLTRLGDNVEFRGGVARMDPSIAYDGTGQRPAVLCMVGRRNIVFDGFRLEGWSDPLHEHYASPFVWGGYGLLLEDCTGVEFHRGSVDGIPGPGLQFLRCSDVVVDSMQAEGNTSAIRMSGLSARVKLSRLCFGSTRGIGPIEGAPTSPANVNRGLSILYPQRYAHSSPLVVAGINGLTMDRIVSWGESDQHTIKLTNCQHVRLTRYEGGGIQVGSSDESGSSPSADIVLGELGSICVFDPDRGHQGRGLLYQYEPIQVTGPNFVDPVRVENCTIIAPRYGNAGWNGGRAAAVAAHKVTPEGIASVVVSRSRFLDRDYRKDMPGDRLPLWAGGSGTVTLDPSCTFERISFG